MPQLASIFASGKLIGKITRWHPNARPVGPIYTIQAAGNDESARYVPGSKVNLTIKFTRAVFPGTSITSSLDKPTGSDSSDT